MHTDRRSNLHSGGRVSSPDTLTPLKTLIPPGNPPPDTLPPGTYHTLLPGYPTPPWIPYPLYYPIPLPIPCPLEGTWDQRYLNLPERTLYQGYSNPPPLVNRLTDTCENITFPQIRWQSVLNNGLFFNLYHQANFFTVSFGKITNQLAPITSSYLSQKYWIHHWCVMQ